jgi:hypothetical protein
MAAPYAITDGATVRVNLVTNCQGNFTDLYSKIDASTVNATEWVPNSFTPVYSSATTFTIASDVTGTFVTGRRVKLTLDSGAVYGTISTATFTTETEIVLAESVLDATLSQVYLGIITPYSSSGSFPFSSFLAGASDQIIFATEVFAR